MYHTLDHSSKYRIFNQLIFDLICIGKRPKHLQLQLDNCGRENKNHVVLWFLGYIIAVLRWFQTVQINFLVVGHTHDEIDQFHSLVTPYKKTTTHTLSDIVQLYKKVNCSLNHYNQM